MDLNAAVAYALTHNPQVRVAAAQRQIALAKLIPMRPPPYPDLQASAYQSLEGPPLRLPISATPNTVVPVQEHQFALTANQILYHQGRSANSERVSAETTSADAAYQDAVSAVRHDTMTAYYQVLQAQSGEAVARAAVTDVQGNVDRVRLLIQAGNAVQLDLLTAQSALGQVQQDATVAQNGRIVAEANFNRVLGRPLDTPVALMGTPPPLTAPASLEEATRAALATRPDIRQQVAELKAARAGLSLAHAEGGPTITAQASYALQTPTALQRANEWTLRAIVSLPVFHTAAQRSDVAQAEAGVTAAEAGLEALRQGDSLLVLRAWQDLQTARSALDADGLNVSAQQEAVRAVGLRRQVGEVTEADVAQARLKLEQAASTQVRDQYNVSLRTIDLLYATGQLVPPAHETAPEPTTQIEGTVSAPEGSRTP